MDEIHSLEERVELLRNRVQKVQDSWIVLWKKRYASFSSNVNRFVDDALLMDSLLSDIEHVSNVIGGWSVGRETVGVLLAKKEELLSGIMKQKMRVQILECLQIGHNIVGQLDEALADGDYDQALSRFNDYRAIELKLEGIESLDKKRVFGVEEDDVEIRGCKDRLEQEMERRRVLVASRLQEMACRCFAFPAPLEVHLMTKWFGVYGEDAVVRSVSVQDIEPDMSVGVSAVTEEAGSRRFSSSCTRAPHVVEVNQLVQWLKDFSRSTYNGDDMRALKEWLSQAAMDSWDHVVLPLLEKPHGIAEKRVDESSAWAQWAFKSGRPGSIDWTRNIFDGISVFFTFVKEHAFDHFDDPSCFGIWFGFVWDKMWPHLNKRTLSDTLPSNMFLRVQREGDSIDAQDFHADENVRERGGKETVDACVVVSGVWEKWRAEIGVILLDFEQKIEGIGYLWREKEQCQLSDYVRRVEEEALKRDQMNLLGWLRRRIIEHPISLQEIGSKRDLKSSSGENAYEKLVQSARLRRSMLVLPTMSVSRSVEEFADMMKHSVLGSIDVKRIHENWGIPQAGTQVGREKILRTYIMSIFSFARDCCDLYRMLVIGVHGDALSSVPFVAVLHRNDCQFLAFFLTTFGLKFERRVEEIERAFDVEILPSVRDVIGADTLNLSPFTFADYVQEFEWIAKDVFENVQKTIRCQLDELVEPLEGILWRLVESDGDKGKHTVGEETGKGGSQRLSIPSEEIEAVALRLDGAVQKTWKSWHGVLPIEMFEEAMCGLIEHAASCIVKKVLDMHTISIKASEVLHDVLGRLMVWKDIVPNIHKRSAQWNAFVCVQEMMDMTMRAIEERLEDENFFGNLTRTDVEKLVVALFVANAKREHLIGEIRRLLPSKED